MNYDCILGSKFLQKFSPTTMDIKNMVFKFWLNGRIFSCPLSFEGRSKCKKSSANPKKVESIGILELYKMKRSIDFSNARKDKALSEITQNFVTQCTSEIQNAFWSREKYFVLPFKP